MNHTGNKSRAAPSEDDLWYQSLQRFTKQNTQHLLCERIPKLASMTMYIISEQTDQVHFILFQSFINPFKLKQLIEVISATVTREQKWL